MDIVQFTEFCLSKPGVSESFPFGGDTLVFKVSGKIFALTGIDTIPFRVNLKCDPAWALELREEYEDIIPGYHMNKKHWNTVTMEGGLEISLIKKLIDHSYHLVARSLPKKDQEALGVL
ncbi:MAG: MmcQ/YjbR family DNA-binding protein [Saprospiraceae bacterium]|jgi:predicted DNA-binding protein (MmcQ/YjbR family)|nr:MmcQ/YjbR family DNA-binding protein [Saprospiraceae bacterium]